MLTRTIAELDLDPIKIKLMDTEDGEGWTREQADAVEIHYKRFLDLNLKHPDLPIVPNGPVDTFWHLHILDTQKYAVDCEAVFGHFLHHFPYFGMRGQEDRKDLERAFERTKELLAEEYGTGPALFAGSLFGRDTSQVCSGSPSCNGTSCNGTQCGGQAVVQRGRPSFASIVAA